MQPFALPRASSRRVRHLSIRSHFHQPQARVASTVKPYKPDFAALALLTVLGFQLVILIAVAVLS